MEVSEIKEELRHELNTFGEYIVQLVSEGEDIGSEQLNELIEKIGNLQEKSIGLKFLSAYNNESVTRDKEEDEIIEQSNEQSTSLVEEVQEEDIHIEHIESEEEEFDHEEEENETEENEIPKETIGENNVDEATITSDLNDAFSSESDPSVSGQLGKQPIIDLLAAIGLNERYLYANELFDGSMEDFSETIQKLNGSSNYEEAYSYCHEELRNNNDWDEDNELYKALLNLIERRFMN